jgi:hypothetical protein
MTVVTTPEASTISTRKHVWSIAFVTACIAVGCNAITGLNQAYSETMCFPVGSCDGGADDATDAPVDANLNVRCYTNDECPGSSSTSGIACCNGSCVDTTNNDQTCGPSCTACNTAAGFSCASSKCTASLGEPTEFSACAGGVHSAAGGITLDYLELQRVCVPGSASVTARSLGAIEATSQSGMNGVLAIYDEDSHQNPVNRLSQTPISVFNAGTNTFTLNTPVTLTGGLCYWIGGDFDDSTNLSYSDADICSDANSGTTKIRWIWVDPSVFPALASPYDEEDGGPPGGTATANFNFFVVVTQP